MKKSTQSKGRVLLTTGPTRAYIDDVRFLSNISTGELGFKIAETLKKAGFEVAIVAGPTLLNFHSLGLKHCSVVETHTQMKDEVLRLCKVFKPSVAIFSAAVLDFEPAKRHRGKFSSKKAWSIQLKPTPKIIDLVKRRFPKIRRIGFKLEPHERDPKKAYQMAFETLEDRKLDALCFNFLGEITGQMHRAILVSRLGEISEADTKTEIAEWIYEQTLQLSS